MKYIPLLLLLFTSCVTIKNPQNWRDDIIMQKEYISLQNDTIEKLINGKWFVYENYKWIERDY